MIIRVAVFALVMTTLLWADSRPLDFFIIPGVATADPGLQRQWVWTGIEGGVLINERHGISVTGRYSVKQINYREEYDSLEGKNSWQYDYLIWGTAYLSYFYDYPVNRFLRLGGGVSMGWQYTETDRNFDTTGIYLYRTADQEQTGELHLRHEAEGRSHSFGGPFVQGGIGSKHIFFYTRFRLNMGIRENWGFYTVKEDEVREIYFPEEYLITDVKIADPGWSSSTGSSLFREFYLLPEIILGLMILF